MDEKLCGPTNVGDIQFRTVRERCDSKYIRVREETDLNNVYEMMLNHWKLEPPRLLISLTNEDIDCTMTSLLKDNLCCGIARIAAFPGCWVVTDGTSRGMMKHVGSALKHSKSCIGIAPFEVLSKGHCLTSDNKKEKRGNKHVFMIESHLTEKIEFLENNHSHFILVDGKEKGARFGIEHPFRRKFEQFIMDKTDGELMSVMLVSEGSTSKLPWLYDVVSRDVPLVVVRSSGGLADLLAYAYDASDEILHHHGNIGENTNHHCGLLDQVQRFSSSDEAIEHYAIIHTSLKEKKHLIHVTSPQGMALDATLLKALVSKQSAYRILELSLSWGQTSLATSLFRNMIQWPGDESELKEIMIMALAMNNFTVVELLLDNGVNLPGILTMDLLEFLYGYRWYDESSPIGFKISSRCLTHSSMRLKYPKTLHKLVSYNNMASQDRISLPIINVKNLIRQKLLKTFIRIGDEIFIQDTGPFEFPFRELFFWAILNNLQEMAHVLWQYGRENMAQALLAAHLCEQMATQRIHPHEEVNKRLVEFASDLRDEAFMLLQTCYRKDRQLTEKVVTTNLHQFTGINFLDIAAENVSFLSHNSIQVYIQNIWFGGMVNQDIGLLRIICSWLFPPLIGSIRYRKKEDRTTTVLHSHDDDDDVTENTPLLRTDFEDLMNRVKGKKAFLEPSFLYKLQCFYFKTPVVKFASHNLGYLIFLVICSFSAMVRKKDTTLTPLEWYILITAFAYFVAELHEIIQIGSIKEWASSIINLLDMTVITLLFAAFYLRRRADTIHTGHLLLALDCGLWWLRLLSLLVVHPTLGPYLLIMRKMLNDCVQFVAITGVFMVAYGVTSTAILKPRDSTHPATGTFPLWQPYFNIYGELFIDRDPPDNRTTRFGTEVQGPYDELVVWCIMSVYLLITNILLLNLLIAVFNDRYNEVKGQNMEIWKHMRYNLIREYYDRSFLIPPFSLIHHIALFVMWLVQMTKYVRFCTSGNRTQRFNVLRREWERMKTPSSKLTQKMKDEEEREKLLQFESNCMMQMIKLRNENKKEKDE